MTLKQWVRSVGGLREMQRKFRKSHGLSETVVCNYICGRGSPTVRRMEKLLKASRGQLTFESVMRDIRRGKPAFKKS